MRTSLIPGRTGNWQLAIDNWELEESRPHAHLADRGELEDEPADTDGGPRPGRGGQDGGWSDGRRPRRDLPARRLPRAGGPGPRRVAHRPGRSEHALGAGRSLYRRDLRRHA